MTVPLIRGSGLCMQYSLDHCKLIIMIMYTLWCVKFHGMLFLLCILIPSLTNIHSFLPSLPPFPPPFFPPSLCPFISSLSPSNSPPSFHPSLPLFLPSSLHLSLPPSIPPYLTPTDTVSMALPFVHMKLKRSILKLSCWEHLVGASIM